MGKVGNKSIDYSDPMSIRKAFNQQLQKTAVTQEKRRMVPKKVEKIAYTKSFGSLEYTRTRSDQR